MKCPKTISGRLTEAIMGRVRDKLPEITTHDYNRVCESILAGLDHTEGIAVVPDNDWAFMATITNWPKEKRRQFYRAVNEWFPDSKEKLQ